VDAVGKQFPQDAEARCPANRRSFLLEFKEIIDRISVSGVALEAPGAGAMAGIIREIEEVGWESITSVDDTFRNITLSITDSANRPHSLSVHLPATYPEHVPSCRASLPAPFVPSWRYGGSLGDVKKQFTAELRRWVRVHLSISRSNHHPLFFIPLIRPPFLIHLIFASPSSMHPAPCP